MQEYLKALRKIRNEGTLKTNRTKVETLSIFGDTIMRYDLSQGFPAVTTKKLHFHSVLVELLWLLSGSTNIEALTKQNVKIWNEWADVLGNLGPVYGAQWRHWKTPDGQEIDQVAELIHNIKEYPDSRRHIVTAWNPADISKMKLPPCHMLWQVDITGDRLSLMLTQRSGDMFLGVPFNIASYAILTMMLAQVTGHKPGWFTHVIGDAHIYVNHLEAVDKQLAREPLPLPTLWLNPQIRDIDGFKYEDIRLENYNHHGVIRAPVAV